MIYTSGERAPASHTSLWVPLGYSPVLPYRPGTVQDGTVHIDMRAVRRVLGPYETIAFHTKRLERDIFAVRILRTVATASGTVDLEVSFAGRTRRRALLGLHEPDAHRFPDGQELYIEGFFLYHLQLVLVGEQDAPEA